MSLKELTHMGKMGMWLVASFVFCLVLCFVPVSDSFTQLNKNAIGESVLYVTLGYFATMFLFSTDSLLFQENSMWRDVFKRIRTGIYGAFTFIAFLTGVSFFVYFIFSKVFGFTFLSLIEYLYVTNIIGLIIHLSSSFNWTGIKEYIANSFRGLEVYHLTLTWHIVVLFVYTYLFLKVLVALIELKATWYSYGWALFMLVVLGISVHRIWNVYINRKGTVPYQLRVKRKALDKSRRAVEKATKYHEKLLKDKSNYQAQLEEQIKKNPDCEEAKLDNLMARIDSLDSRIQIGEQIKRNLEAEHAILANEVQDLENNIPVAPVRAMRRMGEPVQAHTHVAPISVDELREQLRTLLLDRIEFLRTSLIRMSDANIEVSRQLDLLDANNLDRAMLASIINQQRRLLEIHNITTERAERYGHLANILIANPLDVDALHEITNPDMAFVRLEALMQEFTQNEDALRITLAAQPHVENDEDDHMGTDGYPICPNCQIEHNNYDNDQLPYCSSDCQYEHQHCGICRKELPVDERGFNYCQGACQQEAFRRQGNGD